MNTVMLIKKPVEFSINGPVYPVPFPFAIDNKSRS
jgi:hypothetical protein